MVYVFLDTNTLLHFKRPDQIDWPSLLKCTPVTLVFAPVVIRELEEQKVHNHTRMIRERAQGVVTWLGKFIESDHQAQIRPNVQLQFIRTSPMVDFAAHRLPHSIFDDESIASIIEFRDAHIESCARCYR